MPYLRTVAIFYSAFSVPIWMATIPTMVGFVGAWNLWACQRYGYGGDLVVIISFCMFFELVIGYVRPTLLSLSYTLSFRLEILQAISPLGIPTSVKRSAAYAIEREHGCYERKRSQEPNPRREM